MVELNLILQFLLMHGMLVLFFWSIGDYSDRQIGNLKRKAVAVPVEEVISFLCE